MAEFCHTEKSVKKSHYYISTVPWLMRQKSVQHLKSYCFFEKSVPFRYQILFPLRWSLSHQVRSNIPETTAVVVHIWFWCAQTFWPYCTWQFSSRIAFLLMWEPWNKDTFTWLFTVYETVVVTDCRLLWTKPTALLQKKHKMTQWKWTINVNVRFATPNEWRTENL